MNESLQPLVEVCVENVDGLLAAEAGGADRAELCAALAEGGLTPSMGIVKEALERATIPFFAMVRPRGGDFLYSEAELASMAVDITLFRDAGVRGVVFGCLTESGDVDEAVMERLVRIARPMKVTCHRAFDMTRDASAALETLVRCGVDRVLTSGRCASAQEGIETLRALVEQARDRIVILGCGQLDANVIRSVVKQTKLSEVHFSAPIEVASPMTYLNTSIAMGTSSSGREYLRISTDSNKVKAIIAAVRSVE